MYNNIIPNKPNVIVDNNGKIMGYTYKIGANILGNDGKYIGRLSASGEVRGLTNGKIGYLKSNGSYINSSNKISGYALDEVAQNRRNWFVFEIFKIK